MQQSISFKKLLLVSLCASVLTACGSSGGSGSGTLKNFSGSSNSSSSSGNSLNGNGSNSGSTSSNSSTNSSSSSGNSSNSSSDSANKTGGLTEAELKQKQEAVYAVFGVADDELNGVDDNGQSYRITKLDVTINGKTYHGQAYSTSNQFVTPYNINDFAQGLTTNTITATRTTETNGVSNAPETMTGTLKVYNQPYSFAAGSYDTQYTGNGKTEAADYREATFGGIYATALPENGTYNYKGKAFNKTGEGNLDYTITYSANNTGSGQGKITGLADYGEINLAQAGITSGVEYRDLKTDTLTQAKGFSISGEATYRGGSGNYQLGIFGPNATEIAGKIDTTKKYTTSDGYQNDDVISFAGSK